VVFGDLFRFDVHGYSGFRTRNVLPSSLAS